MVLDGQASVFDQNSAVDTIPPFQISVNSTTYPAQRDTTGFSDEIDSSFFSRRKNHEGHVLLNSVYLAGIVAKQNTDPSPQK